MVQQGRLVAAALGDRDPLVTALRLSRSCRGSVGVATAVSASTTRRRCSVADSVRLPDWRPPTGRRTSRSATTPAPRASASACSIASARGSCVRGGRPRRSARAVLSHQAGSTTILGHVLATRPGPEVRAALEGRYGSGIRPTPGQRSLTLYSAVPIRHGDRVVGAALVSQSTFRILQALYDVRLRIFQIVIASFGAAHGIIGAADVGHDRAAARPAPARGDGAVRSSGDAGQLRRVDRKDEIGDLARSLEDLTGRLDAHIRLLESFTGDVAARAQEPARVDSVPAAIAESEDRRERRPSVACCAPPMAACLSERRRRRRGSMCAD